MDENDEIDYYVEREQILLMGMLYALDPVEWHVSVKRDNLDLMWYCKRTDKGKVVSFADDFLIKANEGKAPFYARLDKMLDNARKVVSAFVLLGNDVVI
jgi:hypothetical protein